MISCPITQFVHNTMETNDISNYFMECRDCGYEYRSHTMWSQCTRCHCPLSLMIDLNHEQHERLMQSVNNRLLTLTERDIIFQYILTGDLGLTGCMNALYEMPHAFIAQAFWAYLCHQPSTSMVNEAVEFCKEIFAANVVNLSHSVDEKDRE